MLNSNLNILFAQQQPCLEFSNMLTCTFLLPTHFEKVKPSPCHSQELKELNQWPLFLVTFRLDYASFLTEMEVDVKARMKAGIWRRSFAFGDQLSHFQLPFGKVSCRKGWWRLLRSTCNRVEGFCWSKTFFMIFKIGPVRHFFFLAHSVFSFVEVELRTLFPKIRKFFFRNP